MTNTRPFTIVQGDPDNDVEWSYRTGMKVRSLIGCTFEACEEVIGLIEYETGEFEVGIGECLRPYDELYFGKDLEKASRIWFEAILERAYEEGA